VHASDIVSRPLHGKSGRRIVAFVVAE